MRETKLEDKGTYQSTKRGVQQYPDISGGTCIGPYLGTYLLILSHIWKRLTRTDDHAIFVDRDIENGPGVFIKVTGPDFASDSFVADIRVESCMLDNCSVGGPSDGALFADPESGCGAIVPIIVYWSKIRTCLCVIVNQIIPSRISQSELIG
jgi:hypothetical protein